MKIPAAPPPPPRISRAQAVKSLGARWQPGDHMTLIGPTGRGKSTLMSQMLPHAQHDSIIILSPKGADPTYSKLGLGVKQWPPKQDFWDRLSEVFAGVPDRHAARPVIWRVEVPIKSLQDFERVADAYRKVLQSMIERPQNPPDSIAVILDDSRMISDPKQLNLGSLVVGNLLVARSKRVSLVNNYQAPRWVPREGLDQGTQILMWRNRDRDVVRRLGEIGDLDLDLIRSGLAGLDYYECLWIDGRSDEVFIVGQ